MRFMGSLASLFSSIWPERPGLWALGFAALYWSIWQIMLVMPESLTPWQDRIHLVYLPAFVRALAVVIAGLAGVLGIFLGTLLVALFTIGDPLEMAVSQGMASALAPLLGYAIVWLMLSRRPGPSVHDLILVGLLAALFNAMTHALSWQGFAEFDEIPFSTLSLMMLGDVMGVIVGFAVFRLFVGVLARLFHNTKSTV